MFLLHLTWLRNYQKKLSKICLTLLYKTKIYLPYAWMGSFSVSVTFFGVEISKYLKLSTTK